MQAPSLPDWVPGPREIDVAGSHLDVWRIPIDSMQTEGASRHRHTHASMRDILGRYLHIAGGDIRIEKRPGGKPFIGIAGVSLAFNLSHCRDLALLSVSETGENGIDIEHQREIKNPLRLARRVFAPNDVDILAGTDEARRPAVFFDLWTQLEARQKTLGQGIFAAPVAREQLQCFRFRPTTQHHACVCTTLADADLAVRFFDFAAPVP